MLCSWNRYGVYTKIVVEGTIVRWNAIYSRIKHIQWPVGAEIGVYEGELSDKILDMHKGLTWKMIDAWDSNIYDGKGDESASKTFRDKIKNNMDEIYQNARNIENKYFGRAKILRGKSTEIVKLYSDNFFDIVFIDSDHTEKALTQDIFFWLHTVKDGGYIGGHDYGVNEYPGIKKAVDKIFDKSCIELDEDFTWFVRI